VKKLFPDLKTGVIGVGSMGQNHARIYNEISELVAVSDINEEQGRRVAERFGIAWYSDYREMLDLVDAVTIAVPTFLHYEVAKLVTEAGVHILVEKPLAINILESEAIINLADKHNVTLAVGHVERYNPVIDCARKSLARNEWGELLTLTAKRFSNFPTRIHDVGVLFDLTIHDVDVICSLINSKVKSVFAVGGKSKNEKYEDHVCLIIEFEGGQKGICETNWLTPMKVRELNITTTTCYISINYLKQEIDIMNSSFGEVDESNLYRTPLEINKEKLKVKGKEPLENELVDFLDSITNKRKPLVCGVDGLHAVKIVQMGLSSLQNGKLVKYD